MGFLQKRQHSFSQYPQPGSLRTQSCCQLSPAPACSTQGAAACERSAPSCVHSEGFGARSKAHIAVLWGQQTVPDLDANPRSWPRRFSPLSSRQCRFMLCYTPFSPQGLLPFLKQLWIMPAFGARPQFDNDTELNFYGDSMWPAIVDICLPFGIFYRMHAVASLLEVCIMS